MKPPSQSNNQPIDITANNMKTQNYTHPPLTLRAATASGIPRRSQMQWMRTAPKSPEKTQEPTW